MNKKNDSGKKAFAVSKLFNVSVLCLCFAIMFIVFLCFPRVSESDYDTGLAKFPEFTFESFFSGEFGAGVTNWFSDTVFGRDRFKDISARVRGLYGPVQGEVIIGDLSEPEESEPEESTPPEISENPVVSNDSSAPDVSYPIDDSSPGTVSEDASSADTSSADTSSEPPIEQGDILINSIIIDAHNRAMEIYPFSSKGCATYAGYMNAFYEDLKAALPQARMYSMFIPKQCAYYLENVSNESVRKQAGNTLKAIEAVDSQLNPGITSVDVYNALLPHKSEQIYFRTDHHWTGLGAYYGTSALCKAAGVDYAPLSDYTVETRNKYLGTMYKYTDYNVKLLNNPEDFVTYTPANKSYTATYYNQSVSDEGFTNNILWHISDEKVSSWYLTYICGDSYVVHIKSDECHNGRKLLLFKDSYGNAMSPYLLNSFEEIWIADTRTFELNGINFAKEHEITDVCFATCAFSVSGSVNKYIERLRTQNK